jgi:hypothetical protein
LLGQGNSRNFGEYFSFEYSNDWKLSCYASE